MADEGKPPGEAKKPEGGEKAEEQGFRIPPAEHKTEKKFGAKDLGATGNRKEAPEAPGEGGGGEKKGKAEKSIGVGPVGKWETGEKSVWTNKEGPDDKTYASVLQGKASAEVLSASVDLEKKTAKLVVVSAKAEGSVVHGQVDLIDKIKNLIFGEDPKPPPPPAAPTTPMAARIGDLTMHVGPLAPGPGSSNVFIGGMPAWRIGLDMHLCPAPGVPHGVGPTAPGTPTVLINGAPAARATDFVVEPTGGPDVIALGCPTVFIGIPTPPPPPGVPAAAKEAEPWVIFESVAAGDLGKVEGKLNIEGNADLANMKGRLEVVGGAEAAVLKGELPLKMRIRIPFSSYYVGLGVTVEGSLLSIGAEAGAGMKINDGKTLFGLTAGAKADAGIGGVGLKFGLDVSKK